MTIDCNRSVVGTNFAATLCEKENVLIPVQRTKPFMFKSVDCAAAKHTDIPVEPFRCLVKEVTYGVWKRLRLVVIVHRRQVFPHLITSNLNQARP